LEESSSGRSERDRFSTYLSGLKERGSVIIVVGELPRECYAPFCSNMLGDPASGPRYRLRVTTDDTPDIAATGENTPHPSAYRVSTRHVVSTFGARSAATASAIAKERDSVTHVEGDSLAKLGVTISEEIEAFERAAGELEPAQLRLCFDSLRPFLEEFEEEEVFRFLHILAGRIRSTSGMAHLHLQAARDDLAVKKFEEIFDAVVELDTLDQKLVHCWHVRDRNITSGWLPV
jgi:hypothetical protein